MMPHFALQDILDALTTGFDAQTEAFALLKRWDFTPILVNLAPGWHRDWGFGWNIFFHGVPHQNRPPPETVVRVNKALLRDNGGLIPSLKLR